MEAQYPTEHTKTKHKTLAQCCLLFSNRSLLPTAPGKEYDTLATKPSLNLEIPDETEF